YVPTAGGVVLCILLDYILAFTLLGVTGLFKIRDDMSAKRKITMGIIGTLTACVLRYASHWLSGAVIWYEITKAGGWNDYVSKVGMWTYTTVYNAQYMVPETIMAVIAVPAMVTVISVVKKQLKR
ncbi:MAG: energy-coupled thiamine transporter ThiT, partial [Firmicutes bacterium]|nr:energy-coupled thiamine transporter ThiT [Bacillota bacterium]